MNLFEHVSVTCKEPFEATDQDGNRILAREYVHGTPWNGGNLDEVRWLISGSRLTKAGVPHAAGWEGGREVPAEDIPEYARTEVAVEYAARKARAVEWLDEIAKRV